MDSAFSVKLAHPFYEDHVLYHAYRLRQGIQSVRAWAFNGWMKEGDSWRTGCYIHAGLSGSGPISIKGPGAKRYVQSIVMNSLEKFPVGTMKHAVMCTEDGLIAAHGIIERKGEDHFESFAGGPPGHYVQESDIPSDVEFTQLRNYLFQIAGPASLQILEKVTGENLRDIKFLRFRDTQINGVKTEIGRIGMTGGLAYELHGPLDEGPAIYDAVVKAGQEFGIERLGWGTYLVNHVEGGFPQSTWTFITAAPPAQRLDVMRRYQISGSVDPTNTRARLRTPVEVNWENMAKFDHDFIGRDALAAEMADPKRKTVTLRWNGDDVIDTYASLLRSGAPYKPVELPYAPQRWPMAHADHIMKGGREVGYSSGTIYSKHYREFLSHGCLDIAEAEIGDELTVLWGDHGGPIKEIRATVERFPYFTDGRNSEVDAAALLKP
jgi:vanillate/3-O-methylgallate O-demethylase